MIGTNSKRLVEAWYISFNIIQLKCPSFSMHILFCVLFNLNFHLPENIPQLLFFISRSCALSPAFYHPKKYPFDEMINLTICFWHSDYPTLWSREGVRGWYPGWFWAFGGILLPYFLKWIIVGHEWRHSLSIWGGSTVLSILPPAVEARGSGYICSRHRFQLLSLTGRS